MVMLVEFSVENFRSFKEEAVLSMEASADKTHPDNMVTIGKDRIIKTAAIFGANASGKSNIFMALTAGIMIVRNSLMLPPNAPISGINPFKFDKEMAGKPTSFKFVFYAGGKKYIYGFSATREKIIEEYLYVYNSAKASTIFEREETNKYKITSPALKKVMQPLQDRTASNKLFLATTAMFNIPETQVPYLWFTNSINTYSNDAGILQNQTISSFENDEDSSLKTFTNTLLREADINIDDFDFTTSEISTEELLQKVPEPLKNVVLSVPTNINKEYKITTKHCFIDDPDDYLMSLDDESFGTRKLFFLSPLLKKVFETGETVCIDEFDTSLHPMIVIYLVGLFNNPDVNKANAQLIISSHTMDLLSLKVLRRDQIYFVDKRRSTGVSELYSLDEFSPRIGEDIRKAYLLGRYGSVPTLIERGDN